MALVLRQSYAAGENNKIKIISEYKQNYQIKKKPKIATSDMQQNVVTFCSRHMAQKI